MERVIHKKTGNIYFVVHRGVIECTNGREDKRYVIYKNHSEQLFCREEKEFDQKFTKCE